MHATVIADIPLFGLHVVKSLGAAGHRCDLLCTQASAARWSRYCRRVVPLDRARLLSADAELAAEIAEYVRRRGSQMVIPADLESALLLSEHREFFEAQELFPLTAAATLRRLNNKSTFAGLLDELGVGQPEWMLLEEEQQVQAMKLEYPRVIKPLALACSAGVRVVHSADEIHAYLRSERRPLPLMVQRFVPGEDADLTILADHGNAVAWAIQRRHTDGGIEFYHRQDILDAGAAVVRGVGYHGVIDFDLRIDVATDRPVMIECNPRFPGSLPYKTWAGVNMVALGMELAQGLSVGVGIAPIAGMCHDIGLGIGAVMKTLVGHRRLRDLGRHTRTCCIQHWRDPLPVAAAMLRRAVARKADGAPPVAPAQIPGAERLQAAAAG